MAPTKKPPRNNYVLKRKKKYIAMQKAIGGLVNRLEREQAAPSQSASQTTSTPLPRPAHNNGLTKIQFKDLRSAFGGVESSGVKLSAHDIQKVYPRVTLAQAVRALADLIGDSAHKRGVAQEAKKKAFRAARAKSKQPKPKPKRAGASD